MNEKLKKRLTVVILRFVSGLSLHDETHGGWLGPMIIRSRCHVPNGLVVDWRS